MTKQKLLGVGTSYKTIKSEKVGVLTGILYMACLLYTSDAADE